MSEQIFKAVFFDLGGVLYSSPIKAIEDYELENSIPNSTINSLFLRENNKIAFQQLEKGKIEVEDFVKIFTSECLAAGISNINGKSVMELIHKSFLNIRPEVVQTIHHLRQLGFVVAAITNNWKPHSREAEKRFNPLFDLFDFVVESWKEGSRKPEPLIYEKSIQYANEIQKETITFNNSIFLDDIGKNLKAAKKLGMTTIKVNKHYSSVLSAISELYHILQPTILKKQLTLPIWSKSEYEQLAINWMNAFTGNKPSHLLSFYDIAVYFNDPKNKEGILGKKYVKKYFIKALAKNPAWIWKPLEIFPHHQYDTPGFIVRFQIKIPIDEISSVIETGLAVVKINAETGKIIRNDIIYDRVAYKRLKSQRRSKL